MWARIFERYSRLPLWGKLLVSTASATFIGSAIPAFFTTYAIYAFAFKHGARIPVEGVPFITFSVTMASAMIFGAASFLMFSGYLAMQAAIYLWRIRIVLFMILGVALAGLYLIGLVMGLYEPITDPSKLMERFNRALELMDKRVKEETGSKIIFQFLLAPSAYLFIGLGFVLTKYPRYVAWITMSIYVLSLTLLTSQLFVGDSLGAFLRITRFGGGIQATIYGKEDTKEKEWGGAYLFLYTEKRVILYKADTNTYLEIPADDVQSIEYSQYPTWKLPEVELGKQLQYIK